MKLYMVVLWVVYSCTEAELNQKVMDDLNVPNWLDQNFFTIVLKYEESKDVNIEVVRFSVESAMAPGNNYLSYMYRVRVEYKTGHSATNKTVSLMVKIPFAEGFMKEISEQHNFFEKEPKMYNDLLPSLYKATYCEFGPKSLKCPVTNVLVMKDLKEEGYNLREKTKQMDFWHSRVVFRRLAKFHAASVVCIKNNKELVREVGEDHFFLDGSSIERMAKQSLKNTVKTTAADARYAKLSEFILGRYDQVWPSCTKLTKPKTDGGLNVLNHGDLWTNNIMFKYNDSGEIVDVKFIDFQLSRLGSPVNDLVYFIWTSTNEEVREKRQDDLFNIYLTTLNKTLAALGCEERLSEQELREDIARSMDYVIFVISLCIHFMMAGPENVPDFANLTDDDFESEKFHKIFKGKTCNNLLPNYYKQVTEFFLDNKGMSGPNY